MGMTKRLMGVWMMLGLVMAEPAQTDAACQLTGLTADGGFAVECSGTDTLGRTTTNHADTITVNSGAVVSKTDQSTTETTTSTAATAIDSRGGDDVITSDGTVNASASTTVSAEDFVASALGNEETNAAVSGTAAATAVDVGDSTVKDVITNNGTLGAIATTSVTGGQIQLDLFDVTSADTSLSADATATGIRGSGSSEITNNSAVTATSTASVTAWTGEINALDEATANTGITPHATATGILGGTGYDKITNACTISASATADAVLPIGELNVIDAAVAGGGIGTEADPMAALVVGIDGGAGGSDITNAANGTITATAESTANIDSVILTLYDFTITADMKGNSGSIATNVEATATGINGGSGIDRITNNGTVNATAKTSVLSLGLGIGAEGVPSGFSSPSSDFYQPLFTPAGATITASAGAQGIQGDGGNDVIVNTGTINVSAGPTDNLPTVLSVGGSISFPLLELTGLSEKLKNWNNAVDYPPAIAVASAGTLAKGSAVGIDGGEGNDTITNGENPAAAINVSSKATATTVQAAISMQNVKSEGGTGWSANLDLALAKASTTAEAETVGIAGAGGNDTIRNDGVLNVDAETTAVGVGFSLTTELLKGMDKKKGSGLAVSAALANVQTEATADATGIDGGTGNDTVNNFGDLDADAISTANSTSASISVQGEIKGLGAGIALADTTTTGTAVATGITGGDGADTIFTGVGGSGPGTLHAYADAEADAQSFSVTVQKAAKGVEVGGAMVLGSVTATATSTGIDGGAGNDEVTGGTYGDMDVKATAGANNLAVAVDVQAGVKGLGAGVALIDTTTVTTAGTAGISGGSGDDHVTNKPHSSLKSYADSNAYAESFSVLVQAESDGLVLGGALALGSVTATGTSLGIDGGAGTDNVHNAGIVDANAEATTNNLAIAVDVQGSVKGVGVGVAFTDASSTAVAASTAIAGGAGDDFLYNDAHGEIYSHADANAYAELFSVNVQGNSTGIVIGGAIALADSTATATASGIEGGAGKASIANEAYGYLHADATATANTLACTVAVQGAVEGFGGQAALTDASTFSTATARGITGSTEGDTLTNSTRATLQSYATANAYAESIAVSVQGSATGVTLSGSLARGETTPTATAMGISGGGGTDTLANDGFMDVKAITDSTSVAVAARVVGVIEGISVGASLTDTATTATATATGMDGGADKDTISNYRSITVLSDATLRAASVAIDFGGVPIGITAGAALSSAATTGTGTAIGIDGGDGDDTITNAANALIDVDAKQQATSTAVAISANVIGAAWTDTSATTVARATGIAGGAGKDTVGNQGTIDADSNATADVANVNVNLIGATPVSGWTSTTAHTAGIDTGTGDDRVENERTITADSVATTDATGVAVQVAGYSDMDITTNATATATGIVGGDGTDTLLNTGIGSIRVAATTNADATAVNINLLGYSTTNGKSTGAATVKGIDGSDGDNTITNGASIVGTATVTADASSYDIQLAGGAKATAGTEATATAIGIAGGSNKDTLRNEGTIILTSTTTLTSASRSFKIMGVGLADAASTARAYVTGIDGGEGVNGIVNAATGSINATASTSATATGIAANIGVAGASTSTTSRGYATGIKTGGSADTVTNGGTLNVKTTASTSAASGDLSLFGLAFGDALTEAYADGINGGGGNDTIFNTGTITVGSVDDNTHPMANASVASVSLSLFNISGAYLGAKAYATGIQGGTGNDIISNAGTMTVGDGDWMSKGSAYGFSGQFFEFFSLTSVGASADTVATGIAGGDGNDTLRNEADGVMTVTASSYAWTEGAADTSTFGSPAVFANSITTATATGLSGDPGNDDILNAGDITVSAHSFADSSSDSWVGWGTPEADSSADATATTVGINAGEGGNLITNSGGITADSLAETSPYAKADSDVDRTDADTTAYSRSTSFGLRVGDGGNTINNTVTGTLTVSATATTADAQGNVTRADSDEDATVTVAPTANAIGILTGNGKNSIGSDGEISVTSEITATSHASASSTLYTATATSKSGGSADAVGIKVGDGENGIRNGGTLNVTATTTGTALSDYPTAHLDWGLAYAGAGGVSLTSNATGIMAGNGANSIDNDDSLVVSSTVNASASAYTNTATTTTHAEAYAGGSARATGIAVGNARNVVNNRGAMTVSATATAYALGSAEEYGTAHIGSATSAGITAEAVGMVTGSGANEITNYGSLGVTATATALAEAAGDDGRDTFTSTSSSVTGIRTGNGNNTITNAGSISVEATGLVTSAIGIQTGAGDDVVVNRGRITAEKLLLMFRESGLAITTGTGNDQVVLTDGSETEGTIDLGNGDDRLTLSGTQTVTGTVTGAAGIDTLVFDGSGTMTLTPTSFEQVVKQGGGTYIVPVLATMQRLEIERGVLQVNHDYQFLPGGSFQTIVRGDGSAGQFTVNGTTRLAGELRVVKGDGYFRDGSTYRIIEATGQQGVSGTFDTVHLPEARPLLSFDLHQQADAVQVQAHTTSCTNVATNPAERATARYLDRIMPNVTGDLAAVLGAFQSLSGNQFAEAYGSMSPAPYDGSTRVGFATTRHYLKTLQQRMDKVRAYRIAGGNAEKLKRVLLAYNGTDAGLATYLTGGEDALLQAGSGLWIDSYGQWGDERGTGGFGGYDYDLYGGTIGYDYTFRNNLMLGLSFGTSRAAIDFDGNSGDGSVKEVAGSVYGSYFFDNSYLQGVVSYGGNHFKNHRHLTVGSVTREAFSSHDGDTWSLYLDAGHKFTVNRLAIVPFATLFYARLDEDGFTETGAESLNLTVNSRRTDALVAELGTRIGQAFRWLNGSLIPELRAAFSYDFDIDDRVITSSFAGAPGTYFSIQGKEVDQYGAVVGTGFTYLHDSGISASLSYSGEFREHGAAHVLAGELRYRF